MSSKRKRRSQSTVRGTFVFPEPKLVPAEEISESYHRPDPTRLLAQFDFSVLDTFDLSAVATRTSKILFKFGRTFS